MLKARPQYHEDIRFVQLSKLPLEQSFQFKQWLPISSLMTLVVQDEVLNDCVYYEEYEYWLRNQYSSNAFEYMEV